MSNSSGKQYWLFVTRPKYYLDDDQEYDLKGGEKYQWACHKDTQKGDEILFYLTTGPTKKGKCIKYQAKAVSNAEEVPPEERKKFLWKYACNIEILKDHDPPLLISEIRKEVNNQHIPLYPALKDCRAITVNFQGTAFPLKEKEWECFIQLLEDKKRPI